MKNSILLLVFSAFLARPVVAQNVQVVDQLKHMYIVESSVVQHRPVEGSDDVQISVMSFTLDTKTNSIAKKKQVFVQISGMEFERFTQAVATIVPGDSIPFFVFAPTMAMQRNGYKVAMGDGALPIVMSYGKMLVSPSGENFISMAELNVGAMGYTWGILELQYTVLYPQIFKIPGKDKLVYQTVVSYYKMEKSTDTTLTKIRKRFSTISFDDSVSASLFENPSGAKKIRYGPAEWGRDGMFTTPSDAEWDDRARDDWISKRRSLNLFFDANDLFPQSVIVGASTWEQDNAVIDSIAIARAVFADEALRKKLGINFNPEPVTQVVVEEKATTPSKEKTALDPQVVRSGPSVSVSWSSILGTAEYVVRFYYGDGTYSTKRVSILSPVVFKNVTAGEKCRILITAKDGEGKEIISEEIFFTM